MQLPDLSGLESRRLRPPQSFAIQSGLSHASSRSLPQNLPFELSENRQQSGHRATGWRGQVQSFSEGNETYAKVFQF